jgi:branched-chain amino acid transport system ATP-binding protein
VLDAFGLSEVAETDAGELSFGQLRMLEIARAMVAEPRVLLLDEPAAGLNAQEAARVGEALKRLKAEGLGILVVDHDVRFLFNLCDDIVAMDYGRVIAAGPPDAIERDPQVRAAYLAVDPKGGA